MGHLTFLFFNKIVRLIWRCPIYNQIGPFCIFSTFSASTQPVLDPGYHTVWAMRTGHSVSRLLFLCKQGLHTFPLWTVLKLMLASTPWTRKLTFWSLLLLILMPLGVYPRGNRSNGPRTRCSFCSHSPFSLDCVPIILLPSPLL